MLFGVCVLSFFLIGGCPPVPRDTVCSGCIPVEGRAYHSATPLLDGQILILGGGYDEGILVEPVEMSFSRVPGLPVQDHTAGQLSDGRVFVVESVPNTRTSVHIQDQDDWQNVGEMSEPRFSPNVTVAPSDAVAVTGGDDLTVSVLGFDPFAESRLDEFSYGGTTPPVLLADGTLLLPNCSYSHGQLFTRLDLGQAAYQTTPDGPALQDELALCSCVSAMMSDGRVFYLCDEEQEQPYSARAWLYDPGTSAIREVAQLYWDFTGQTAVAMSDGRVAIVGGVCQSCSSSLKTNHKDPEYTCSANAGMGECGCETVLYFDPADETLKNAPGPQLPRLGASWSLLPDDRFLVYGGIGTLGCDGYDTWVGVLPTAEVISIPSR